MQKLPSGKWRVQWRKEDGGRDGRVFDTKREALEFMARKEAGEPVDKARQTFAEFAKTYLEVISPAFRQENTVINERSIFKNHLVLPFGKKGLDTLTEADLVALMDAKCGERTADGKPRYSPVTINQMTGLAKKIMAAAVKRKELGKNPFIDIKQIKVGDQAFSWWTVEERDKFLRFCHSVDPEFYEIALVAALTGLRCSELAGLTRGKLDFEHGQIEVSAAFSFHAGKLKQRTKTNKIRYVPMHPAVRRVLMRHKLASSDHRVFNTWKVREGKVHLARIAKLAGVKRIRFHDLRHTFASNLVQAGVTIYEVSKLLGHANSKMTERYSHLAPSHLTSAISKLGGDFGTDSAHGQRIAI